MRYTVMARLMMLMVLFCGPRALAEPFNSNLGPEIDNYMAAWYQRGGHTPPVLVGYGSVLYQSGLLWDVDPRLIVAISIEESSAGTDFNPTSQCQLPDIWGWHCAPPKYHSNPYSGYTLQFAIDDFTSRFKFLYLKKGRKSLSAIAPVYCDFKTDPKGCAQWEATVTTGYTSVPTLGSTPAQAGNLNDLSFHPGLVINGTINFTRTTCYQLTPGYCNNPDNKATASFVYDKTSDTFTSFTVAWHSLSFDFTSVANLFADASARGCASLPKGNAFIEDLVCAPATTQSPSFQNGTSNGLPVSWQGYDNVDGAESFAFFFFTGSQSDVKYSPVAPTTRSI